MAKNILIRGTTPTHIFPAVPFLSEHIKQVYITYFQNGSELFTKTKDDCAFENEESMDTCDISVTLSQEETLSFSTGRAALQMRILDINGSAYASEEQQFEVQRVIHDGRIQ